MGIGTGYRSYICLIAMFVFLVLSGIGIITVVDSMAEKIVYGLLGAALMFTRAAVGRSTALPPIPPKG